MPLPPDFDLALLGCKTLVQAMNRHCEDVDFPDWTVSLPRACHLHSLVNMAAAAFAATHMARVLSFRSHHLDRAGIIYYHQALTALQKEVSSPHYDTNAILIACSLLLSIELILKRHRNALFHLQGALVVLSTTSDQGHGMLRHGADEQCSRALFHFFRTMDFQAAAYLSVRPPTLPTLEIFDVAKPSLAPHLLGELDRHITPLLHSCSNFIARACRYKYLPRSSIPLPLIHEQDAFIATLTDWVLTLEGRLKVVRMNLDSEGRRELDTLPIFLVQCLSMIIYTSTIMDPSELSYDNHTKNFLSILHEATLHMERAINKSRPPSRVAFRLVPGFAQPLYLTATKCRQLSTRLQAISLLYGIGSEGPWNGRAEAAVASRVVEIEMNQSQNEVLPGEVDRVHGAGTDLKEVPESQIENGLVQVMFSKAINIQSLTSGELPPDHPSLWVIWHEWIAF